MKTLTLFVLLAASAMAQFTVAPVYVLTDPSGPCVNQNQPKQWSLSTFTEWYCSGTPGTWTKVSTTMSGTATLHWMIDHAKCDGHFGLTTDQALHVACKILWASVVVWSSAT